MRDYNDLNWKAKRAEEMTSKIKKTRDADEADVRAKNAAHEATHPEYKATMDKVRAAMKEHEAPHWGEKK